MAPERYRATVKQTPQPRNTTRQRAAGTSPRRPLTEEQLQRRREREAALQREMLARKRREQKRKMHQKRLFRFCFILSLVLVAIYWTVVTISIVCRPDGTEDALPLLLYTDGASKADKEYEPETVCIGSQKYLPIHFLEKYFTISEFGDHETRSFQICSTGEFVTFFVNTEEGIINGQRFSMKAPALVKDEILYLPVEFYGEKMHCFEYSKNNSTYGADVLTFYKDRDQTFIFHENTFEDYVDYKTAIQQNTPATSGNA